MRGPKHTLERVERHGEEHLVHDDGCQFPHLLVLGQVVQMGQREQVFLKVAVGIPFGKASRAALVQPLQGEALSLFPMPLSRLARIAKGAIRVALSGEDLTGVKEDAVVLCGIAHAIAARFIVPVLEIEHARLDRLSESGRKRAAVHIAIHHAQQADQVKVAAVLSLVDPVDGTQHIVVADSGPSSHLKLGDLGVQAAVQLDRVSQRLAATFQVGAVGRCRELVTDHEDGDPALDSDVADIELFRLGSEDEVVLAGHERGRLTGLDRLARLGLWRSLHIDPVSPIVELVHVADLGIQVLRPMEGDVVSPVRAVTFRVYLIERAL